METAPVPAFGELISGTRRWAVHLEMRDVYDPGSRRFATWQAGHRENPADRREWWSSFHQVIAESVARGVQVRRARVVSEPVSEYVRFEHDVTFSNIAAGEQVWWLVRRRASDLALPANDFWVFDDRLVRLSHFAGDGRFVEDELNEDPMVVKLCVEAFASVGTRCRPSRLPSGLTGRSFDQARIPCRRSHPASSRPGRRWRLVSVRSASTRVCACGRWPLRLGGMNRRPRGSRTSRPHRLTRTSRSGARCARLPTRWEI